MDGKMEIEAWAVLKNGKFVELARDLAITKPMAIFASKIDAMTADEMINQDRVDPVAVRVKISVIE